MTKNSTWPAVKNPALRKLWFAAAIFGTRELVAHRLEHYELVCGEDGRPVELGRGAMGVTYKAVDVDLRCPVTVQVISERYLGDESARLHFLREARAAASLRHPNVAKGYQFCSETALHPLKLKQTRNFL
jgi:hypothetical protein